MKLIEELLEHVNKLKALLDDPQPGLFTWNDMVGRRVKEISKFGCKLGE